MKTSDFDYYLPLDFIAQTPIEPRDQARLMILNRRDGSINHQHFFKLVNFLQAGDVLVFNDSRVIPARLYAHKDGTGGKLEILLLRRLTPNVWEVLIKPARRASIGSRIEIINHTNDDPDFRVNAEIVGLGEQGLRVVKFSNEELLMRLGQIPLPPYVRSPLRDPERYQTIYAKEPGSVAAPTAGLHFTPELMSRLKEKDISCCFATLHVGLDSFRPIREEDPLQHSIHNEYGVLTDEVAEFLSQAKVAGRRIVAVGTTTVRLLEAVAQASRSTQLKSFTGWVDLYILPGYKLQMVDALITNFHLPRSTLLMLVTAFAGKELIDKAYHEAIVQRYRFYSFGDAMMIL